MANNKINKRFINLRKEIVQLPNSRADPFGNHPLYLRTYRFSHA